MKATVRKTGSIVELKTKRGEYYIDTLSNPYKEEELDFDVPESAKSELPELSELMQYMTLGNTQFAVQIAVQYMENHPTAIAEEVCEFTEYVITKIKKL